jgi:3-phosphoshikimate 1-carboxyvinyltransferase
LGKIGSSLHEHTGSWTLVPSQKLPASALFNTYKDHRMAMAFAPLATRMEVTIENPGVVKKSYPRFWDDIASFGFTIDQEAGN